MKNLFMAFIAALVLVTCPSLSAESNLTAGAADTENKDTRDEPTTAMNSSQLRFDVPAFWGTRLINLPTSTPIDKRMVLFRISHRFYGPVRDGYDTFFGLDQGANVFFSLDYGLTDRLGISVGRSRLFQEWEFGFSWLAMMQGSSAALPFSVALHADFDWATVAGSDHLKLSLQVIISRQFNNRLSIMVVPAFSTNTNFWGVEPEGTFAIGLGSRYMILNDFSLIAEWVPVVSGYHADQNGWGFGFEKKIGGHVFQVFVTNTIGLTSSQFLPGGDLRLKDFDFRLGFNIFRMF
jgi:hypothetical protein